MSESPNEKMRTIRQTSAMVRAIVEQETLDDPFWVSGIVKHYHLSDFGHIYFDLCDEDYSIDCMMRQTVRGTLPAEISNGMELAVLGILRVYEKRTRVQIEVEKARLIERKPFVPDQVVQERLQQAGLYPKSKRPLPETIHKIGIVTSKHSDALPDFETTYRDQHGTASTRLVDVLLQGERAPIQIANAIHRLSADNEVDVVAIIRGGGRDTELAIFNDYLIAEAICRCNKPVITGIGHQRDETFADLVADISAITPTAAALHLAQWHKDEPKAAVPAFPTHQVSIWLITTLVAVAVIGLLVLIVLSKS